MITLNDKVLNSARWEVFVNRSSIGGAALALILVSLACARTPPATDSKCPTDYAVGYRVTRLGGVKAAICISRGRHLYLKGTAQPVLNAGNIELAEYEHKP